MKKKKKICREETGASSNQKYYKMCLKKAVFWSESAAAMKAHIIKCSGGPPMRAYNCPNCLQWHLTSTSQIGERKN